MSTTPIIAKYIHIKYSKFSNNENAQMTLLVKKIESNDKRIVNYHLGGDQPTHPKVYNAMDAFHPLDEIIMDFSSMNKKLSYMKNYILKINHKNPKICLMI